MKNIKTDKTLDIDIVELLSCIETLIYKSSNSENVLY